jgi:hypothetical protein
MFQQKSKGFGYAISLAAILILSFAAQAQSGRSGQEMDLVVQEICRNVRSFHRTAALFVRTEPA